MTDEDARTIGRRATLRTIGGLSTGSLFASVSPAVAQGRPTITVSSPECERLHLEYTQTGPTASVTLAGPTTKTITLNRGDTWTDSVNPGEYTVTAEVEQAQGQGQSESAIAINGSPITVDECSLDISDVSFEFPDCERIRISGPPALNTQGYYASASGLGLDSDGRGYGYGYWIRRDFPIEENVVERILDYYDDVDLVGAYVNHGTINHGDIGRVAIGRNPDALECQARLKDKINE